jgi:hypothetical protein
MRRRLSRIIVTILSGAGVLSGAVGHAAQVKLDCPTRVRVGGQLATMLTIDVDAVPLGAYSVTVAYDPAVLTIASVEGGTTSEFTGAPTTNTASFTPGSTIIAGLQSSSLTAPTGVVSVARVTFDVRGAATTPTAIGVTVRDLFDTRSAPIPATATGCTVLVKPSEPAHSSWHVHGQAISR